MGQTSTRPSATPERKCGARQAAASQDEDAGTSKACVTPCSQRHLHNAPAVQCLRGRGKFPRHQSHLWAAKTAPRGRCFTDLEWHLLRRGPPGWGWLLRLLLQLLPVQRKNGKDKVKTRRKFRCLSRRFLYLPADTAQGWFVNRTAERQPAQASNGSRSAQPVLHQAGGELPQLAHPGQQVGTSSFRQRCREEAVKEQGNSGFRFLLPAHRAYARSSTPTNDKLLPEPCILGDCCPAYCSDLKALGHSHHLPT